MARERIPTTMAVRFMREHDIRFEPHFYRYAGGGAKASARLLDVNPLRVAKTLLFEDETRAPLVIVMNGPLEVGPKRLARHLACKRVVPCAVSRAEALSGYRVGGISPFGQRTPSRTLLQLDLLEFATILLNGGQRGFLVELDPAELERSLAADLVDVAAR